MTTPLNQRKQAHLRTVISHRDADRRKFYFRQLRLMPRALPEMNLADVDPRCSFLGKTLSFPLLISSMTGGVGAELETVNRNLALAAEATGIALAVGSQRVMLADPAARPSFALRRYAPTIPLCGNLGAVQLNKGLGRAEARAALEVLEGDGLYLHLNALQEVVQPGGDTEFGGLAARIGALVQELDRPVLVKEVGSGLSVADAELLLAQGVRHLDVAGAGGTSWSRIEHECAPAADPHEIGRLFQDWGLPTPLALERLAPCRDRATLIASGGLRSGLDLAKALVLGASLGGIARPLLEPALQSAEAVVAQIERLKHEFTVALFLLGARTPAEIIGREELILGWDAGP
ncbi:MAG: type 2 isopentenyl-diphosphate Delta-isomerase [Candidatus Marinimicrobia bacterium]|nr:type 2 isopentenyl-diphosphate Delta-isomerase [Candidatus Neomarinimicrobiota bacterium]